MADSAAAAGSSSAVVGPGRVQVVADLLLLDTDEFIGPFEKGLGRVRRREKRGPKKANGANEVWCIRTSAAGRKVNVVADEVLGENAMTIPEDWERLLSTMNRADKAQLLQWIVRDLGDAFPGIESDPLVCGGEPCIVRTRMPVWVLVQARNLGMSEADILKSYPTLRAEDLANAWGYYRAHRSEIDDQIKENEAE